jgi:hypothetical protein
LWPQVRLNRMIFTWMTTAVLGFCLPCFIFLHPRPFQSLDLRLSWKLKLMSPLSLLCDRFTTFSMGMSWEQWLHRHCLSGKLNYNSGASKSSQSSECLLMGIKMVLVFRNMKSLCLYWN